MRAILHSLIALSACAFAGCQVQYRPMEPFTSKEGNFSCVFPGGAPSWRIKAWSFPPINVAEGINPGIEYAAGYGDTPFAPKASDLPKIYSDMKDKVAAEFKATIIYHGETWIDGFKGFEFVMKLPAGDDRHCKMRAVITGKRAHMYGVVCDKGDLHSADVQRFFQSFKFIEKPKVEYDFNSPGMSGTQTRR